MDNWLKTGRLASGKRSHEAIDIVPPSPAESTGNISEEAIAGSSVGKLYLPSIIYVRTLYI